MSLPTEYQTFIATSRYARWREEDKRRETWGETVNRYVQYWADKIVLTSGQVLTYDELKPLEDAIFSLKVLPSMRALMTAGVALDRDNMAGFNCSYIAVDSPRAFDETLYILCCGTGTGFSVERQYVQKLPEIAEEFHETETTIVIRDSKIGWATAFKELISMLYNGQMPRWDMSKVRPAGSPLKTFGGRASGPEPLEDLFRFTVEIFRNAKGRKLTSIECHDLMCKIAEVVVVGGVRRSALISLSNLTDERMRVAKSGEWWNENPQRALANNSVCYTERPDMEIFMKEWLSLVRSKSGERGIYNREAANKLRPERREEADFGTNPCSEINLRSKQVCNLSEIVVRPDDTFDTLKEKARIAAILGTLQATLTDFRYLSTKWRKNTEEEALLGVSLTGIMDHPILSGNSISSKWFCENRMMNLPTILTELKEVVIETNKEWAEKLGINPATATTAIKPSGTVSQLVDSASGIHPRYSEYYIRTVRADKKDPLTQFMVEMGFPVEDDVTAPHNTSVFSFPMKAPDNSIFRDDRTAIQQLEQWKLYAVYWCEHKPSITVYVREHEWMEVGAWVYKNFDILSGVSFLPHSNHTYRQAPYQEINKEKYEGLLKSMPRGVDWGDLRSYEEVDTTTGVKELACSAGGCEI
jgi:ribonucleoside-diphosphate reductase alpha chain